MRPESPTDDLVFGNFLKDLYHSIHRIRLYPVPLVPSQELTRQIAAVNGLDDPERFRERVGRCRHPDTMWIGATARTAPSEKVASETRASDLRMLRPFLLFGAKTRHHT